jgi:hypothetical protein
MIWNARHPAGGLPVVQVYAPDERVTARAWVSEEAEATVIDLENLEALPDDHEVRAFAVAGGETGGDERAVVMREERGDGRMVFLLRGRRPGTVNHEELH